MSSQFPVADNSGTIGDDAQPWRHVRITGFRERRDRPFLPSHGLPANLAGIKSNPPSSLVCGCENRLRDFQAWRFVPGVICRPSGCCCLCGQPRPISFSFGQNRPGHVGHRRWPLSFSFLDPFLRWTRQIPSNADLRNHSFETAEQNQNPQIMS